jgi:cell wall-associated NlpC family hydrolase
MRSSIRHARYRGQHVKPALHPTRSTLSAGLTAVLLPLCMASPALAQSAPGSEASATSTATIDDPEASPSPDAGPAAEGSAQESAKLQTELRISGGPGGTVSPGSHTIGVRLLADDKPVKNGYVRLERKLANGSWEYVGRLLTRSDGLGVGKLSFATSTRLRAIYQGAATRTPATSREIVVAVSTSVSTASFRQQAVKVASQQRGKPYRRGMTGPSSFDCSGLMVYVFQQVGKNLPRTSQQQLRATQRIAQTAKQPGDLIFTHRGGRVGHVGVYAGNGQFWVAPKPGDRVKLQKIYTSSYYVGRVN